MGEIVRVDFERNPLPHNGTAYGEQAEQKSIYWLLKTLRIFSKTGCKLSALKLCKPNNFARASSPDNTRSIFFVLPVTVWRYEAMLSSDGKGRKDFSKDIDAILMHV